MPASRRALTGPPLPPVRILVVDDDPEIRRLLSAALSDRGFSVRLAANPAAALVLCAREGGAIDVVLLDSHLPGPLDCFETLAAFGRLSPGVPCCFMSANPDPRTTAALLGGGALAVVAKPFRLGELAAGLRELAGRDPAGPSGAAAAPDRTGAPVRRPCPAVPGAV